MITEGGSKPDQPRVEIKKKKQRGVMLPAINFVGAFVNGLNRKKYKPTDYTTPEELEHAISVYFNSLLTPDGHVAAFPTLSGLSLHLGFSKMKDLEKYKDKQNAKFQYLLDRAKLTTQYFYEIALTTRQSPAGAIFALKAGFDWRDKPDMQINIQNNTTVVGQLAWDDDPQDAVVIESKTNGKGEK